MIRAYLFALITGIVFVLWSCAPAGYQRTESEAEQPVTLAMATQTWQRSSGAALPAVEDLVNQADAQIAMRNLDVAAEKLERALRISPDYAPAWSRMAYIALGNADPARAIQMAKRSNSHAGKAVDLKLLNWDYIRKASHMLGDVEGVQNASKSINILRSL